MENTLQIRGQRQDKNWAHWTEASGHAGMLSGSVGTKRRNRVLEDQLATLRREHDDLLHTMYEAAQVQRKLCGPRLLRRQPFEIASEIFPVRHLSGDFISVFELGPDLAFAIGDIAGKGLSAGMWFTYVVGMVRLQMEALGDPAAALSAINRNLLLTHLEMPLTTVLVGRLNLQTGEVTYCSAGHPPALVFRNDGHVESLQEGGPVLGVLAGACFANGQTTLRPGDTLLGYSDGIAECRNENGAEFGTERLAAAAQVSHGSSASGTLFSVLGAVEDFAGSQSREDDMAVIVVRRADE
ncbi:MAG TPA: PP2C family protein-serine/threonine phosphatase [Terriglobales bacterium]|nr:PP2C family protein-serine/threonine phosphatase [Terriglobales bacterium]